MRIKATCLLLLIIGMSCRAQYDKRIVLIDIDNDRLALLETVQTLNAYRPKLICLNVGLIDCNEGTSDFLDDATHSDSSDRESVLIPNAIDKLLAKELRQLPSLLLASEIQIIGDNQPLYVVGCTFIYPPKAITGFTNLINSIEINNQIERVKLSEKIGKQIQYHFATRIAFALEAEKTRTFIESHQNILNLDTSEKMSFNSYTLEDLKNGEIDASFLKDKVVIVGYRNSDDHLIMKRNNGEFSNLTSSEIIATIACMITSNDASR